MDERAHLKELLVSADRGSATARLALHRYVASHRVGEVLSATRAAEYCGLAVGTLYNLSSKQSGPCAHKHGRKTVYYPVDLDIFLHSRVRPRGDDAFPPTYPEERVNQ